MQLIGELTQHEGSPVICLGGSWGKVCDVLTHAAAAVVICRQLGFSNEGLLKIIIIVAIMRIYILRSSCIKHHTISLIYSILC